MSAASDTEQRVDGLLGRLFSQRIGAMLARNTVVSCSVFGLGLILLWALVDIAHVAKVPAAGLGFLLANSLHYLLGRAWIFRGTERGVRSGYLYFLLNSGVGLLVTMGLYALLLPLTPTHYLLVRSIISLFAGLVVFVLNAAFNFRQV
ncbi:GtrA family protein [Sphingobium sp. CAP-1]|uniref:GtrA family protein n=1 Tax=Sphingobium sp. CAP-1 TaxID=2676077 RepID=UPI0012BB2A8C|nr:GtrA family protein [Sphingobium sp. CAP-1]QGP80370.1 GtrA family protein [Sphingobium sp. CAP-1]